MEVTSSVVGDTIELCWFVVIFLLVLLVVAQFSLTKENGGALWHLMTLATDYGKLNPGKSIKYFSLPKRTFTHFYAFSAIWSAMFLCDLCNILILSDTDKGFLIKYFVPFSSNYQNFVTKKSLLIIFSLMFFQGSRRLYECVYVSKFSKQATINIFHYFLGCFFYLFEAMTVVSKIGALEKLPVGILELRHIFGITLFIIASYYQHQSFVIFSKLRKNDEKSKYKIPVGGLFEFVSCPHYFTEILIYVSLYFILGFSHYSWGYPLMFVIMIHLGMAKMSHDWYLMNFKHYPKQRKALIPFVY